MPPMTAASTIPFSFMLSGFNGRLESFLWATINSLSDLKTAIWNDGVFKFTTMQINYFSIQF